VHLSSLSDLDLSGLGASAGLDMDGRRLRSCHLVEMITHLTAIAVVVAAAVEAFCRLA